MTQVSELTASLQALRAQLEKARTEIVGKITALETALAAVDLPPEAATALAELAAVTQALDDIVPDAPIV